MPKWRPVLEWEGLYEVSDDGRVRSLDRVIVKSDGRQQAVCGRVLAASPNGDGYPCVRLCDDRGQITRKVHHLVLAAFVGPRPAGMEALHADDNPINNHATNLRWGTRLTNAADRRRNGGYALGDTCKQGHQFTPENTNYTPSRPTTRVCRTCRRNATRKYRERIAA